MIELPSGCRIPVKRKENLLRENGLPISLVPSLAPPEKYVHRGGGKAASNIVQEFVEGFFRLRGARKTRFCKTQIQRRLEMRCALILQGLSSFLIGTLCRLEMQ